MNQAVVYCHLIPFCNLITLHCVEPNAFYMCICVPLIEKRIVMSKKVEGIETLIEQCTVGRSNLTCLPIPNPKVDSVMMPCDVTCKLHLRSFNNPM